MKKILDKPKQALDKHVINRNAATAPMAHTQSSPSHYPPNNPHHAHDPQHRHGGYHGSPVGSHPSSPTLSHSSSLRRDPSASLSSCSSVHSIGPMDTLSASTVIGAVPTPGTVVKMRPGKRRIRLLSIDGGGIRGVVCASMLRTFEQLSGKRISELFDIVAGTSTGGLLALLAAAPGPDGKTARFTADDMVEMYIQKGAAIFQAPSAEEVRMAARAAMEAQQPTPSQLDSPSGISTAVPPFSAADVVGGAASGVTGDDGVVVGFSSPSYAAGIRTKAQAIAGGVSGAVRTGFNVVGTRIQDAGLKAKATVGVSSKYSPVGMERILEEMVGDTKLAQTVVPILIPAYNLAIHRPFIFSTEDAQHAEYLNFRLRDVARATTAAPTYFPPAEIQNPIAGQPPYCFVDGGLTLNNPALSAFLRLQKQVETSYHRGDVEFVVVSLGTGEWQKPVDHQSAKNWGVLQWAIPLIDMLLDGSSTLVDQQMEMVLPDKDGKKYYYRLQPRLTSAKQAPLDNTKDANIQDLIKVGQDYISANHDLILDMLNMLQG